MSYPEPNSGKDLEAQNATGGEAVPRPELGSGLARAEALLEKVRAALKQITSEESPAQINLTDPEAVLMKSQQGLVAGYNAQAVVSPLETEASGRPGMLITAAEVVNEQDDHAQLVPMLQAAEENTERRAEVTLADAGYHSGANVASAEERGDKVLMPEAQRRELENAYHKTRFEYDSESNTYVCPQGEKLQFERIKRRAGQPEVRVYRAPGALCRHCSAFDECTRGGRQGRGLEVGPFEEAMRRHRAMMATEEAKATYKRRKELSEPVFGILKELQGARRFLLRGLANVHGEWSLLATAFNLRTLWQIWKRWSPEKRGLLTGAMSCQ